MSSIHAIDSGCNAVVLSATTFCWENGDQSLDALAEVCLTGKIAPIPGLIDTLRESETQTLIHFKKPNAQSPPAPLHSGPDISTIHNRGKPPGRSSPPTCWDFSLLGHIFPFPPSWLWLTDFLRFSGDPSSSSSPEILRFPQGFCAFRSIRELSRTPQDYPLFHLIAPKRNSTKPDFGCWAGGN